MIRRQRFEFQQLGFCQKRREGVIDGVLEPHGELACGHESLSLPERLHGGLGRPRRLLGVPLDEESVRHRDCERSQSAPVEGTAPRAQPGYARVIAGLGWLCLIDDENRRARKATGSEASKYVHAVHAVYRRIDHGAVHAVRNEPLGARVDANDRRGRK